MTPRPKARARAATALSRETIRDAALALIDRDGLDAFSLRKLGQALRCEAMALYWYYPNKDALLYAVVDALIPGVARAVERGADDADWVAALRRVAHAYRQIAHDHPKAFPLLATRRFATESTYAFMESLFELARAHGIPDRTTGRFYRIVSAYCSGFALNELAPRGAHERATAAMRRKYQRVAAVSEWLEPRHLDDIFDVGLELMLAALVREREAAGVSAP